MGFLSELCEIKLLGAEDKGMQRVWRVKGFCVENGRHGSLVMKMKRAVYQRGRSRRRCHYGQGTRVTSVMPHVVMVDQFGLWADGVKRILGTFGVDAVVDVVGMEQKDLVRIQALQPDVVCIDAGSVGAWEFADQLGKRWPAARVVLCLVATDPQLSGQVARRGWSCLTADMSGADVLAVFRFTDPRVRTIRDA